MRREGGSIERTTFVKGSGNVFADIGVADPAEALAKARLAEAISDMIGRRGLTQTEAAAVMGVDQPKVSLIVNGRLDGFSQDRLTRYLRALGAGVEIVVHSPKCYEAEVQGPLFVTLS